MEFKMEDGKLVCMQINRNGNGGKQLQLQRDGAKINLYYFLTLDGGEHLRGKFELKEGKLVGSFSAQHDNPKKWIYDRVGTMTVTKVEAEVAPAAK